MARAAYLGNERLPACSSLHVSEKQGNCQDTPLPVQEDDVTTRGLKDYRIYVISHTTKKRLFRVSQVKGRHCAELRVYNMASNDPTEGQKTCIFRCLKSMESIHKYYDFIHGEGNTTREINPFHCLILSYRSEDAVTKTNQLCFHPCTIKLGSCTWVCPSSADTSVPSPPAPHQLVTR